MDPLIIIATPNISWMHPEVSYPHTPEEMATEAGLCQQAGASILHIHAEGQWIESIRSIRARCEIIIQCGMSSLPIPERMEVFTEKADMISVILNHHDEAFAQSYCNVLHTKDELLEYARLCSQYGVLPEFEVWHAGSIWNLNYLIEKNAITSPYVTTLFFGWPGGTWSPPTVEEYLYRRKLMPDGCIVNVSIMGEGQRDILAAAIAHGDHVRVGTEDYPFTQDGNIAECNALVKETADMARAMGREVATVDRARSMIGLKNA